VIASLWSSSVETGTYFSSVLPLHRAIRGTRLQAPCPVAGRLYDWQVLGWL
jgi:hypothetical protein